MWRSAEVGDAEPLEHVGDLGALGLAWRAAPAGGPVRDMSTHSLTVTGKFQLTVSSCGT